MLRIPLLFLHLLVTPFIMAILVRGFLFLCGITGDSGLILILSVMAYGAWIKMILALYRVEDLGVFEARKEPEGIVVSIIVPDQASCEDERSHRYLEH